MAERRFLKPLLLIAIPLVAIAALAAFWNWDWLIPIVERRASSTLGRQTTIDHLHVQLGRVAMVTADNVRIANPDDFPEQGDFARIARLSLRADVMAFLRYREIVLPEIVLERPEVRALQTMDRKDNYTLPFDGRSVVKIGDLRISEGQAHVVIPSLKADFVLSVATREGLPGVSGPPESQIVVNAKGTY
ncbi:MAG: AsmA family protein, partial [Alphaproteobacteria bacterium]|nr:AsmA family protein [Alphaproteobacteria bacterium]